ncbi:lytic polysaccharide monooxygenase [Aplosporella prunicola CBS 121167]|uniref:Lytic polysaccharide monooxygenase n=1 Tax=Aplosporella prunicola CBS 121167 TaxID=1176127 RepID=A0A6A6B8U5_9PEZI|nr:lytic polysaccharide monooxygenase [Aplosporella prunicola CBS 121167]KAF2140550.1 lytic polysaccharide monooxygenase [Aplosporella prunicola CBS 121167]
MAPKLFTLAIAMLAASPMVSAHINLMKPLPYDYEAHRQDKGPMTANEYPCKTQTYAFDSTKMEGNTFAAGEKQQAEFEGSAVHGGGSCQFSITTDKKPTKDSKFKVIGSIEGGCPEKPEGFTIPKSVPTGEVTFAWTWFARLSGGPEMYMNCAPIKVTGGASDTTEFDKLPDMLIANIAGYTGTSGSTGDTGSCTQVTSTDLKFPNPGSVLTTDSGADLKAPTGSCGSSGSSDDSSSSSGGAESSAAAGTPAASTPAASTPAASTPAAQNTGGVFAPGAANPSSTMTTLLTVTASGAGTPAASTPAAVATPAAGGSSSSSGGSSSSSSGSSSGTCSSNGAIVCNGTSKFGLCNNGNVVWQDVAAGTQCKDGAITKRELPHGGRYFRPRGSYL